MTSSLIPLRHHVTFLPLAAKSSSGRLFRAEGQVGWPRQPRSRQVTKDHDAEPVANRPSATLHAPIVQRSYFLKESDMRLASVASAFLLALLVAIAGADPATALEKRKFDAAGFKAAQGSNKSILVDISATWSQFARPSTRFSTRSPNARSSQKSSFSRWTSIARRTP